MQGLRVIVTAGPNGSGKTSVVQAMIEEDAQSGRPIIMPERVINPDAIRKLPEIADVARAEHKRLDEAAQQVAYRHREAAMRRGESFAFETVMSHPSKLAELAQLRAHGYYVQLLCVSTNSPDINVRRVAYRVKTGTTTGHDVPEDKTRSRYDRTTALLPAAVELADQAFLYDNSYDGRGYTRQAVIEQAIDQPNDSPERFSIEGLTTMESWAQQALEALALRQKERLRLARHAQTHGLALARADFICGNYIGTPLDLQLIHFFGTIVDLHGRPTLIIHDRLNFMPHQYPDINAVLRTNQDMTLTYSPQDEPVLSPSPSQPKHA